MSGGFPAGLQIGGCTDYGTDTSNTVATSITANNTQNVKGSYSQLVAATSFDACGMLIYMKNGKGLFYSLDLAIGAGGAEKIIAPDLVTAGATTTMATQIFVPICIPKGTRISARCQANAASAGAITCAVYLCDGGLSHMVEGYAGIDAIGFGTANYGTAVTSGATSAKGSYAQLIASTARDYAGLFAVVANSNGNDSINIFMDTAVGAGGSEQDIILNTPFRSNGNGAFRPTVTPFIPIQIPKGTRLATRIADDRGGSGITFGVTLYGVYQ